MFTVLNSYKENNKTLYAVRDFDSNTDLEIVTDEELKLLLATGLGFKSIKGSTVSLDGDTLNIDVDDITEQLASETSEDEVDDFYSAYEEEESPGVEDNTGTEEGTSLDDFYSAYDEEDTTEEEDSTSLDDFYNAYEEEDTEPSGSVVSSLYSLLTDEQIKVLKRYYLWYSQRLFNDAQKDPTFGLSNKRKIQLKRNALNQLRGSGDWRYAGFLDTGSVYAGYTCSLGHALRYMHLAWDITVGDIETCFFGEDYNLDFEDVIKSNNCIIFGIKCIGDFFEVDKDCIKNLQRAQRESLSDMAIMYTFYENNTVEGTKESFKAMDGVVQAIAKKDTKGKMTKSGYKPILPYSLASFYLQFRNNDMIPPKSLVQTIRSCIMGWTDGETYFGNKWVGELYYPKAKFSTDVLPVVLGIRAKDSQILDGVADSIALLKYGYASKFIDRVSNYLYTMFAYEICGVYKYDADTNKDEGGRSKVVREQLSKHYKNNTSRVFEDLTYDIQTARKLLELNYILSKFEGTYSNRNYPVEVVQSSMKPDKDTLYLSDISSLQELIESFDKETSSELFSVLTTFTSLARRLKTGTGMGTGFTSLLYRSSGSKLELDKVYGVVTEKFADFDTLYNKFLDFVNDRNESLILKYNERKAEEIRKENEMLKEREQKEQEHASIDTPAKLVEFLTNNVDSANLDSSWDLPKNILETVKKSGKEPSDRQFYHLKRLFKEITGVDYAKDDKVQLVDRQDLKEAIEYILGNDALVADCLENLQGVKSDKEKYIGVLNSIIKYGKISPRQMRYAESAKKVYDTKKGEL